MKNYLFISALLISFFTQAFGQSVYDTRFLCDGKEWVYELPDNWFHCETRYFFDGDTILDGHTCKRLFVAKRESYGDFSRPAYHSALFEDGQKVFCIKDEKRDPLLVYDFGLSVGDRLEAYVFCEYGLRSCDLTVIGEFHVASDYGDMRVLSLSVSGLTRNSFGFYWIDGVGGNCYLTPWESSPINTLKAYRPDANSTFVDILSVLRNGQSTLRLPYRPMLVNGRKWKYCYHHFEEHEDEQEQPQIYETKTDYYYILDGDTVIDGRTWHKMYKEQDGVRSYDSAWLEEDMQIWKQWRRRIPGEDESSWLEEPALMFDFRQLPYEFSRETDMYFTYSDSIDIDGELYMRHHYRPLFEGEQEFIVEGIGGVNGLSPFSSAHPTCICDYSTFEGVYDGDNAIFIPSDFYRDPVTSGIGVSPSLPVKQHNNIVYDLQGRRVAGNVDNPQLPRGVYIRDGRKFVVR